MTQSLQKKSPLDLDSFISPDQILMKFAYEDYNEKTLKAFCCILGLPKNQVELLSEDETRDFILKNGKDSPLVKITI